MTLSMMVMVIWINVMRMGIKSSLEVNNDSRWGMGVVGK